MVLPMATKIRHMQHPIKTPYRSLRLIKDIVGKPTKHTAQSTTYVYSIPSKKVGIVRVKLVFPPYFSCLPMESLFCWPHSRRRKTSSISPVSLSIYLSVCMSLCVVSIYARAYLFLSPHARSMMAVERARIYVCVHERERERKTESPLFHLTFHQYLIRLGIKIERAREKKERKQANQTRSQNGRRSEKRAKKTEGKEKSDGFQL